MKNQLISEIFGWLGVIFILINSIFSILIIFFKNNNNNNIKKNILFILISQILITITSFFWIIYAFIGKKIYLQTGISNIILFIFSIINIILYLYLLNKKNNK